MTRRMVGVVVGLALASTASAQVDAKCAGLEQPDNYEEQIQQDFLQNYVGLSTTLSPLHGPIPSEPGHGSVGLDFLVIPPLGCASRFVLDWTKTEDTNKIPLMPRPRVTFSFPAIGSIVPYAGFAYVPPVTLAGTRATVVSGEFGAGMRLGEAEDLSVGVRVHATAAKVVADIATAFRAADPAVLDYYQSNTFGGDLSVGYEFGSVTPYASLGIVDVSTFFLVGDDGVISNNLHPYVGPAISLGADGLVGSRFRWGAEIYAAPGGNSRPDDTASSVAFGRSGHLYTARFRVAVEL